MALSYRHDGFNPDGTPHFIVESDSENPHFVLTGKHAEGVVRLPDGTSYDVTPGVIEAQSHEHAGLIGHLIGEMNENSGKFGPDYRHDCTDHCGSLKREG